MMFFENQQFQKRNTFTSNNSEILKTNCFSFFFNIPVENIISTGIGHQFQPFYFCQVTCAGLVPTLLDALEVCAYTVALWFVVSGFFPQTLEKQFLWHNQPTPLLTYSPPEIASLTKCLLTVGFPLIRPAIFLP